MTDKRSFWFPAKRYGWGWGPPSTWQGWAVLVGFMVLLVAGSVLISPAKHIGWHFAFVTALSAALVGICYAKGEPPKWRWGEGRDD
jgi:hypothetical protein